MSNHKTKVPPPATVTAPDPGAKDHNNLSAWIKKDMDYKNSLPQKDYSTGSGEGFESSG